MANPSLQIGNSNWAIKEDDLLGYSTVGTNYLPKPMTMTRESAGTRVNSAGLVETVELLGSELVDCGGFECATPLTYWTEAPSGVTISGGSVNFNSASDTYVYQDILTTTKTYKIIFSGTINSGSLYIGENGVATNIYTAGTYTNEVAYFTVASSSRFIIRKTGVGTLDATIDNVSVKEVTRNNLARVDYTDGTSSLLAEPERTNLVTYSEDFSQSYWILTTASVSLSTTTSPDGLATSYKLIPDNGTGGNRSISKQFNGLSNNHTHTCFAKKGEYNYLMLRMRNSPNVGVMFDLENGTFNLNSPGASYVDSEIESIGNGWYKCSITLDPSQSVSVGQMYISMSVGITGSETHSFNGDGTSGIYIWGCGFEEGSYPTSYIPTYGTTVTRLKDQYEKTGISDLINSEEGVLFVEMAALTDELEYRILSLSDGTTDERVYMQYTNVSNTVAVVVKNGGSTQANMVYVLSDETQFAKIAVKWKVNDFALWVDGVERDTDTSGSVPTGLNRLAFDNSSTTKFYGKVKQLQVYKTALTDSELETLTT